MRKLICSICAAMLLVMIPAASSAKPVERETLKKVLTASGNMEGMVQGDQLAQLNQLVKSQSPSLSEDEAAAKVQQYMTGQFFDDMTELMAPYYAEMTDEECNKIVEMLNTPKMQGITGKMQNMSSEIQNKVGEQSQVIMTQIMGGEEKEPIAYETSSASFRQKFDQYYQLSGAGDAIEGVISGLRNMLGGMVPDNQKEEINKMLDKMGKVMNDNMKPMLHNAMKTAVSEEDFDAYIEVYSTPEMQKFTQCGKNMAKDLMNIMTQFVPKMMEGLK